MLQLRQAYASTIRHPATSEALRLLWTRIFGNVPRSLMLLVCLAAEARRLGCLRGASTPIATSSGSSPSSSSFSSNPPLLAVAAETAVIGLPHVLRAVSPVVLGVGLLGNVIGSAIDGLCLAHWSRPLVTVWFRPPQLVELRQAEQEERRRQNAASAAAIASTGTDQPPTATTSTAPEPPVAASSSGGAREGTGGGATAGAVPSAPESVVVTQAHRPVGFVGRVWRRLGPFAGWLRSFGQVSTHVVVMSTLAEGFRRSLALPMRAATWGALVCWSAPGVLSASGGSSAAVAARVSLLLDASPLAAVDPLEYFRVFLSSNCTALRAGQPLPGCALYAAFYPAVLEGVARFCVFYASGSTTVATKVSPMLRRRVFRPLYRRWPILRSACKAVDARIGHAALRLALLGCTTTFTVLKYRAFVAALLGAPYEGLGGCFSQAVSEPDFWRQWVVIAGLNLLLDQCRLVDFVVAVWRWVDQLGYHSASVRRLTLWLQRIGSIPPTGGEVEQPAPAAGREEAGH